MKKGTIVLIHFFFWLIYLVAPTLLPYIYDWSQPKVVNIYRFTEVGLTIASFYLFYSILIPIFQKRKRARVLLYIIIPMIVLIISRVLFMKAIDIIFNLRFVVNKIYDITIWVNEVLNSFVYVGFAIFIRFTVNWFNDQKLKAELLTSHQANELALLKAQLNPHFLFNTMNNIYSLVYKKSDDAPAALMKLSEIMRYMLYESNSEKVLLEREVEYLKSLIELQELRIRHKDFVEFNIIGDMAGKTIPPMLLISFVENAYKHGSKLVKIPGIKINLEISDSKICFSISNYKQDRPELNNKNQGIGLANIKRRLELLYLDKHSVEITEDEEMFKVDLCLNES